MTYEEAKMQIQAIPGKIWDQLSEPDREAMEMAFSALEKQIPEKPKMPMDAYWICPVCGKKVEHPYEHCRGCGQAILWSEGEG